MEINRTPNWLLREVSRGNVRVQLLLGGKTVTWTERLLVVRSFNYVQSMQESLHRRLDKAEKALRNLTPARQRGKRQIKDEESLLAAIARIEKSTKFRVSLLTSIARKSVSAKYADTRESRRGWNARYVSS